MCESIPAFPSASIMERYIMKHQGQLYRQHFHTLFKDNMINNECIVARSGNVYTSSDTLTA